LTISFARFSHCFDELPGARCNRHIITSRGYFRTRSQCRVQNAKHIHSNVRKISTYEIALLAKTLNFFVATSVPRLLTAKLKDFAPLFGDVIICAVLAVLTSRSAPALPTRKPDGFAAGAQIITLRLTARRASANGA
jgi:hypothetical protein